MLPAVSIGFYNSLFCLKKKQQAMAEESKKGGGIDQLIVKSCQILGDSGLPYENPVSIRKESLRIFWDDASEKPLQGFTQCGLPIFGITVLSRFLDVPKMRNHHPELFLGRTQNGKSSSRAVFGWYPRWGMDIKNCFRVVPKMGMDAKIRFRVVPKMGNGRQESFLGRTQDGDRYRELFSSRAQNGESSFVAWLNRTFEGDMKK